MLSVKQVAEMLSLTPRTIYKYIKSGKLKAYKIGYVWRIYEQDLERFIKSKQEGKMIKLTEKGRALFEATHDYTINEIKAVQNIYYEKLTEGNFHKVTALPNIILTGLRNKKLITGF